MVASDNRLKPILKPIFERIVAILREAYKTRNVELPETLRDSVISVSENGLSSRKK